MDKEFRKSYETMLATIDSIVAGKTKVVSQPAPESVEEPEQRIEPPVAPSKTPAVKSKSVKEQDKDQDYLNERYNGSFILIPRFVLELTNDQEVRHFLAYGLSWQNASKESGGWWFRFQDDIEADTKISVRQQRRVRKILTEWGILCEQRRGIPKGYT